MKLNLMYGSKNILSGYTNLRHVDGEAVNKLDEVCENAECEHIVALDVIDYFSSREVAELIDHWVAKLRHGGKIVIGGIDINEVAKALFNKNVSLLNANIYLYGDQGKPWDFRKSSISSDELRKALENLGLKILKVRTNNYFYTVEAQRP